MQYREGSRFARYGGRLDTAMAPLNQERRDVEHDRIEIEENYRSQSAAYDLYSWVCSNVARLAASCIALWSAAASG